MNISIQVSGDCWYNQPEVEQLLANTPKNTDLLLDMNSEGPSLQRLGITSVIDAWLDQHNQDPSTVTVTRWSNSAEQIRYKTYLCSIPHSHFWRMSRLYKTEPVYYLPHNTDYLFGLFLGRGTISRNVILYQTQQQWADKFLISRLKSYTPEGTRVPEPWNIRNFSGWKSLELLDDWLPVDQHEQLFKWFRDTKFTSLDNRTVRDQFGDPANHGIHNRSMLEHYHKFSIELVCETYTLGNTFFPTEKTVRPIMGTKPWLIYGAPGYIQRLRQMGFQSFDALWDESYDQLEGAARWVAIQKIIRTLSHLNATSLNMLLEQAHQIALFNRQTLNKFLP
jgi:hypothetical protein